MEIGHRGFEGRRRGGGGECKKKGGGGIDMGGENGWEEGVDGRRGRGKWGREFRNWVKQMGALCPLSILHRCVPFFSQSCTGTQTENGSNMAVLRSRNTNTQPKDLYSRRMESEWSGASGLMQNKNLVDNQPLSQKEPSIYKPRTDTTD